MHPVLFSAFGSSVASYTVLVTLAIVGGILLGGAVAVRAGYDIRDVGDLGLVSAVGGLLGAKIFHTLFEAKGHRLTDGTTATGLVDLLKDDPWHWARLFEAGYVFYGGPIVATLLGLVLIRRRGLWPPYRLMDCAVPGFGWGILVGRLGCFLAGCCHGSPTELPWGIQFPTGHVAHGHSVHPVQLYDALFGALLLAWCAWRWKRRAFPGELFATSVGAYAIWRFSTELVRADTERGVWLGGNLSTSQLVSALLLPMAGVLFFLARRAARTAVDQSPARAQQLQAPP